MRRQTFEYGAETPARPADDRTAKMSFDARLRRNQSAAQAI